MGKTFSRSCYANAEDLYKAKAEYYQQLAEKLQSKLDMVEIAYDKLGQSSEAYDSGCDIIRVVLGK